jgi:hypothetical protein
MAESKSLIRYVAEWLALGLSMVMVLSAWPMMFGILIVWGFLAIDKLIGGPYEVAWFSHPFALGLFSTPLYLAVLWLLYVWIALKIAEVLGGEEKSEKDEAEEEQLLI